MVPILECFRGPVTRAVGGLRSPVMCSARKPQSNGSPGAGRDWSRLTARKKSLFLGAMGFGGMGWALSQGSMGGFPDTLDWQGMRLWVSGKSSDVTDQQDTAAAPKKPETNGKVEPEMNGAAFGDLVLVSGATIIPHPSKVAKGGEDAYFISDNKLAIGVADGVGGWTLSGVDPGEYARKLMANAKEFAENESEHGPDTPKRMLSTAHKKTDLPGSSTACILSLDKNSSSLYAANLGDSGFLVYRGDDVVVQSQPQQYRFNFPYQLAYDSAHGNQPEHAEDLRVQIQPGDIIIAATDGLWDNLFVEECTTVLQSCKREGMGPQQMSKVLALCAQMKSFNSSAVTPFLVGATENGIPYRGGKPDDITVVVSIVTQATASKL